MKSFFRIAGPLGLLAGTASAISLDVNTASSVKAAASTVAFGMMKYYTGNNTGDTPGNLPDPYFWWEAGAMFGTMIDYWAITGDSTYNDVTMQALVHQAGDNADFMPTNQTRTEGNDDQGFWGMAAMSAAEANFPNPPADQPQWLALAQAVFNEYVSRWDTATCNGGLRWQIFTFNNGFNYKNSISNGCFFNIAARLARFTGNTTYSDWAEKVYDWMEGTNFISPTFQVFDGAGVDQNCTQIDRAEWTYNSGIFMHGSAVMYNFTNNTEWKTRTQGFITHATQQFFNNSIMQESACEPFNLCDNDQQSFKTYLARWMSGTTQLVPGTFDTIIPLLKSSAAAAALQCSGSTAAPAFKGTAGTACGFKWTLGAQFDGIVGVGEQMAALSTMMYTLVNNVSAPVTANSGGTSQGNVNAGTMVNANMTTPMTPITTADRVAAGFLTTAIAFSVLGGGIFITR